MLEKLGDINGVALGCQMHESIPLDVNMIEAAVHLEEQVAKAWNIILNYCVHEGSHQGVILDLSVLSFSAFEGLSEVKHRA